MSEVKWIKITTNMFEDEKIDFIESLPEADTIIVVWVKLLTLAGKINSNGYIFLTEKIPYTDEMMAHKFRRSLNTVKLALETLRKLEMIEFDNLGFIRIANWDKHQNINGLDKIREQNRLRQAKYREKQKELEGDNVTITLRDGTDIDIDKEEEYSAFFEEVWNKYPNKKGKGKVSNNKKKEIFKLGEEFTRCIDRYVKEVQREREEGFKELKYQNGSTFFNSGYVDYLDENYKPSQEEQPRKYTIGSDRLL